MIMIHERNYNDDISQYLTRKSRTFTYYLLFTVKIDLISKLGR